MASLIVIEGYLGRNPRMASRMAYGSIRRLLEEEWDPSYQRVLYILSLFLDHDDAYRAVQLLQDRSPTPLAYRLARAEAVTYALANDVSIGFIYHIIGNRPRSLFIKLKDIEDILGYPPTLMRERTYYLALQAYIYMLGSTSELDLLDRIDMPNASLRARRIRELFPTPSTRYPVDDCRNDMGLVDSMDEVPPMYRYHLDDYCLPVSDIYNMVIAGTTRNPYTGTTLEASTLRDMNNWLYRLERQGYPIARSVASDFYEPITEDISITDPEARGDAMVAGLKLEYYVNNANALANRLGISVLALQGVPNLIRYYYPGTIIKQAIYEAYPALIPIFRRL